MEWRDDLPPHVAGRARHHRVLLDRALLDGWLARSADADTRDPATRAALSALQDGAVLGRPAALLTGAGYSLPQAHERATAAREGDVRARRLRRLGDALRTEARAWLPPARRAVLDDTEANVTTLGARLRRLHEDAGGLRLR